MNQSPLWGVVKRTEEAQARSDSWSVVIKIGRCILCWTGLTLYQKMAKSVVCGAPMYLEYCTHEQRERPARRVCPSDIESSHRAVQKKDALRQTNEISD